jgi:metal-responsive CopG/Arc/MetJ family transcriptional regulator
MSDKSEKLTISVPKNLLAVADRMAAEMNISRSGVISLCLQEMADRRKENAMKEGYLAMAEQHHKFADITTDALQGTPPVRRKQDGK